jgi:hypothetical protein
MSVATAVLSQGATWAVFSGVLGTAWLIFFPRLVARVNADVEVALASSNKRKQVISRPYVLAISAYAVVGVWFYMLVALIFCYLFAAWCLVLFRLLPMPIRFPTAPGVMVLLNPVSLFECVSSRHMATHAIIAAACIALALCPMVLYIQDQDLIVAGDGIAPAARSKIYRVVTLVMVIMMFMYGVYAVSMIAQSFAPRT